MLGSLHDNIVLLNSNKINMWHVLSRDCKLLLEIFCEFNFVVV